MSTVEVLAPVRLETRFVPPALRTDGVNEWMLRLRVYPDEFSTRRSLAPPTSDELDRLSEVVTRMSPFLPCQKQMRLRRLPRRSARGAHMHCGVRMSCPMAREA